MENTTQTQTQTAPASGDAASSASSNSNAGSESSQTVTPIVDKGSAEGKSASSDGKDGAADDGERQRPGRAERRISELSSKNKELETKLAEQQTLMEKLKANPVDPSKIKFPDYSQMDQVTPDQLKKDILDTANQLVDAKMDLVGSELLNRVTQREVSSKSEEAIRTTIEKYSVLNPESEDYDKELDVELSAAYAEAREKNPSYSFTSFIKPFQRILDQSSTTDSKGSTSKTEPRGRGANRPTTPVRRSNEFPENGTADEMEKWFAENRG